MKLHNFSAALLFIMSAVMWSSAWCQESPAEPVNAAIPAPVVDKGPDDALNRGTPSGSIDGFLDAASTFNWEKAAEYLDLRNLPEDVADLGGPELARQLNHILSRAVWLDDFIISDSPEGLQGDGLPGFRDELVTLDTSDGEVSLWLQKVPRGDGISIWKLSNRSVALIPELYDEFSYSPAVERVRSWFPEDLSFLGLEVFKWFIILVVALIAWPVYWLLGWILSRLFSSPESDVYPFARRVFTGPLVFIAVLSTVGIALNELGTGAYAQQVMKAQTLSTVAIIWALWATLNLFKKYQQHRLEQAGRPGAAKLMQPLTTLAKILVILFGLLFWLNNIGVNITTVLAGLGVGGLAVALALQRPIEDMMGALTIFSQAPVRVGDWCRYGNEFGAVEDIGLRTTRLRTLANTVVSVPNSLMANVEVENLSYRTRIRYCPTLRLRYDTTPSQIRKVIADIVELLEQDDRVHDEPLRVRFTDFAEDAILIKLHAFIKTTNFSEFLAIAEDLNIGIMEIVETAGTRFALPGRALQLEGGSEIAIG